MSEKYSKTTGEKVSDVMRKISNFKMDEKVDVLIDKFEEMVTETEKLKLAERMRYALSLQFIERLEKEGKINIGEKLRLGNVIGDLISNDQVG